MGKTCLDSKGTFTLIGRPLSGQMNEWERKVIATENRPRRHSWPGTEIPTSYSELVADAFQDEGGKWKSLQSDFVIVSRRDDGSLAGLSLIPWRLLADAKAKLRCIRRFAEQVRA